MMHRQIPQPQQHILIPQSPNAAAAAAAAAGVAPSSVHSSGYHVSPPTNAAAMMSPSGAAATSQMNNMDMSPSKQQLQQQQPTPGVAAALAARRSMVAGSMLMSTGPSNAADSTAGGSDGSGDHFFEKEIKDLLYACGDVRHPQSDTVHVVEEILRETISKLVVDACKACIRRGDNNVLTLEDLLYVIQHDFYRIKRITDFLSLRDTRNTNGRKKRGNSNEEDGDTVEDSLAASFRASVFADGKTGESNKKPKLSPNAILTPVAQHRMEVYAKKASSNQPFYLDEQQRRLKEIDEITKPMSREEYIEYSECRQANFSGKSNFRKLHDFLILGDYSSVKIPADLMEIIAFLMLEIVNDIARASLTVKQDSEYLSLIGRRRKIIMEAQHSSTSIFNSTVSRTPLKVNHVREAYRRKLATKTNSNPLRLFQGGLPTRPRPTVGL